MREWERRIEAEKRNQHTIYAKAGDLGLTFDGARVMEVAPDGPMFMQVAVGWQLLSIDERKVDPSTDIAAQLAGGNEMERRLHFQLPERSGVCPNDDGTVTVWAPPGPLGLTLSNGQTKIGKSWWQTTIVENVAPASSLSGRVCPGMRLLAIDGVPLGDCNHKVREACLPTSALCKCGCHDLWSLERPTSTLVSTILCHSCRRQRSD